MTVTLTTEKTVRELALEIPAATRVFENLGIDYCCGGNKSIEEACRAANLIRSRYWIPWRWRSSRRVPRKSFRARWRWKKHTDGNAKGYKAYHWSWAEVIQHAPTQPLLISG